MDDRITGYILLISGIVVMLFASIQLVLLIAGLVNPFRTFSFTEVFSTTVEAVNLDQEQSPQAQSQAANQQIQQMQEQAQDYTGQMDINPKVVNDVLNFAVYFFAMAFAVNVGAKIADLGVRILRPTTIKVHPKNIEEVVQNMPDVSQSSVAQQQSSNAQGKTMF